MYRTVKILFFMLCLVLAANGQTQRSKKEVLSPGSEDLMQAKKQKFQVFKILPRGMFDLEKNELSVRGGGSYYSFVKKSHSYDNIPQIHLQNLVSTDFLSVGFYGINYGFIANLGEVPLAEVSRESKDAKFLIGYKAASDELSARYAYQKIREGFEFEGTKYSQSVAAVVGRTYILRAISFNEADALVAFHVYRKEADGGLIIFWKLIGRFKKPYLKPSNKTLPQL